MWRIRDVYPGSRISDPVSRIPDLGSRIQKQQQKRGVKKNFCHTFYVATNFTKWKIIFVLKCWRKKFGPIFKVELFTQKIVTKLSKIRVWDPRSGTGKNLFRIPDPGVKKAPDPGARIRIRNTGLKRRVRNSTLLKDLVAISWFCPWTWLWAGSPCWGLN